ncbi:hypothetical protein [Pontibacillus yanchengensis]|uniref:Uncharacterized protein n=1 Tax=Pontibacillus yanchengensis Y32 TaxID=1385514 RepID=A0A0A2TGR3_9BACI|nr:hypothetical protein [Pontibacillus yanchengensis]KGP73306.1 hypothetical protein N782_06520 [Pontibacillus yanchengensis Y32]
MKMAELMYTIVKIILYAGLAMAVFSNYYEQGIGQVASIILIAIATNEVIYGIKRIDNRNHS